MTKLQQIKTAASQVSVGLITTHEASAMLPSCRFEMMANGRCYWFDYASKLQGSEARHK